MTQINPGASLLLSGVVGSTAFGLANENSDKDYLGIFVAPTTAFLGLETKIQESYSFKDPDTTYHEAGKYCRLALRCNPTVLDLMWLERYNVRTILGTELVNIRNNFLSAVRVRDAYFGYAKDQYNKLLKDPRREKRAKNARHFARLLYQGRVLYRSGQLEVMLPNPYVFVEFGEAVADGDLDRAKSAIGYAEEVFNQPSVLPENPNTEPIEEWLLKVRHEFYRYPN